MKNNLTILKNYPYDRHLVIGEASIVITPTKEKSLIMACPGCGVDLALINHTIIWHDENTVTVEPSIQHEKYGEAGSQVMHFQCGAHFFIKRNVIEN